MSVEALVANLTKQCQLYEMMFDNEDVEYEQVITAMVIEESLLRANLSVSSRIVQPTLVDFLR